MLINTKVATDLACKVLKNIDKRKKAIFDEAYEKECRRYRTGLRKFFRIQPPTADEFRVFLAGDIFGDYFYCGAYTKNMAHDLDYQARICEKYGSITVDINQKDLAILSSWDWDD